MLGVREVVADSFGISRLCIIGRGDYAIIVPVFWFGSCLAGFSYARCHMAPYVSFRSRNHENNPLKILMQMAPIKHHN